MKKIFFSIKFEIMIFMVTLTLFVVGIMSFAILNVYKKSLINEIELRGNNIAKNIANNIAETLLFKYDLETAKILKEAINNKGVIYAMVVDKNNKIIAHNDMLFVKKEYVKPGEFIKYTQSNNIIYKIGEGEKIIDFSVPVIAKKKIEIGTLHLGMTYSIIDEVLKEVYINIIIITIAAIILSIIGSFFLSITITRPINALTEGAKIIGGGNLDYKINIKRKNELGVLAATFNMMTDDLKKAQELAAEKRAFERELEIAAKIQEALLPKNFPKMEGYNVSAYYKPAKEIGGDYYDVMPLKENRFGIVMADVSGKGIPAALIMTMLSGIINIEAREHEDIKKVIMELNNELLLRLTNGMFVTLFFGLLDIQKNILEMISAGYHEIFVYRKSRKQIETFFLKSAAIGFLDSNILQGRLEKKNLTLESGDKILLFTDGVTDAKTATGERFGIKRLEEIFLKNCFKSTDVIIEEIKFGIENFSYKQEQNDDIAIMVIEKI